MTYLCHAQNIGPPNKALEQTNGALAGGLEAPFAAQRRCWAGLERGQETPPVEAEDAGPLRNPGFSKRASAAGSSRAGARPRRGLRRDGAQSLLR